MQLASLAKPVLELAPGGHLVTFAIDCIHFILEKYDEHQIIEEDLVGLPKYLEALEPILKELEPKVESVRPEAIKALRLLTEHLQDARDLVKKVAKMNTVMRMLKSGDICKDLQKATDKIQQCLQMLSSATTSISADISGSLKDLAYAMNTWHLKHDEDLEEVKEDVMEMKEDVVDMKVSLATITQQLQQLLQQGIGLPRLQNDISTTLMDSQSDVIALSDQERQVLHLLQVGCDDITSQLLRSMWHNPDKDGEIKLVRAIGRGGAGVVYQATMGKEEVAVKFVMLSAEVGPQLTLEDILSSEDRSVVALRRELSVVAHVGSKYKHVCRFKRIALLTPPGLAAKQPAIVMELYKQGSLETKISPAGMELPQALKYSQDILQGLDEMHRAGFVVMDVKPSNVLLRDDGGAVLADFGIARGLEGATRVAMTSVMGTINYKAPEQFKTADATFKTDMWAFAATVVHMLSGAKPFAGQDDAKITRIICVDKLHPAIPAQARGRLAVLLKQCFQRNPSHRPTAKQALELLQQAKAELEGVGIISDVDPPRDTGFDEESDPGSPRIPPEFRVLITSAAIPMGFRLATVQEVAEQGQEGLRALIPAHGYSGAYLADGWLSGTMDDGGVRVHNSYRASGHVLGHKVVVNEHLPLPDMAGLYTIKAVGEPTGFLAASQPQAGRCLPVVEGVPPGSMSYPDVWEITATGFNGMPIYRIHRSNASLSYTDDLMDIHNSVVEVAGGGRGGGKQGWWLLPVDGNDTYHIYAAGRLFGGRCYLSRGSEGGVELVGRAEGPAQEWRIEKAVQCVLTVGPIPDGFRLATVREMRAIPDVQATLMPENFIVYLADGWMTGTIYDGGHIFDTYRDDGYRLGQKVVIREHLPTPAITGTYLIRSLGAGAYLSSPGVPGQLALKPANERVSRSEVWYVESTGTNGLPLHRIRVHQKGKQGSLSYLDNADDPHNSKVELSDGDGSEWWLLPVDNGGTYSIYAAGRVFGGRCYLSRRGSEGGVELVGRAEGPGQMWRLQRTA